MTAEHDNAKPIILGDYASVKPNDVAGLRVVMPMSGEATSPANPRQTAH